MTPFQEGCVIAASILIFALTLVYLALDMNVYGSFGFLSLSFIFFSLVEM